MHRTRAITCLQRDGFFSTEKTIPPWLIAKTLQTRASIGLQADLPVHQKLFRLLQGFSSWLHCEGSTVEVAKKILFPDLTKPLGGFRWQVWRVPLLRQPCALLPLFTQETRCLGGCHE